MKKPPLTEDEQALFRDAMKDVKPLQKSRIIVQKPRKSPVKYQVRDDFVPDREDPDLRMVSGQDLLRFARSGISPKTLKRLRAGYFPIEAELDLHGMTVTVAHKALNDFLHRCHDRKLRAVRIIHGKGLSQMTPVLKNKVNQWLRLSDFILAFQSANPHSGGSGAVVVLLRRLEDT